MSSSVDTAASKKDGALIRPTTDRAKGSTEEALLRLEEGLRDAGLRAALLVLGQNPASPERSSQTPSQSPPREQSGAAQRPGAAFLTEEAVLRLEEGLRAQREQRAGRRFVVPPIARRPAGSS